MSYFPEVMSDPVLRRPNFTETEERFLLNITDKTTWEVFWDLCACGDGINREVLARILTRLSYMEGSRTRHNKRRELKKILQCVMDAKDALTQAFCTPTNPHLRTIQELQTSAEWIGDDLACWDKGRAKRGIDPKTPVLVALMAFVRHATDDEHYSELAQLVSAAYGMSGSERGCTEESLKMLWERHSDLRKNWQGILGLSPVQPAARKMHAPGRRLLGSGPGRFKPPNRPANRVLGLKTPPKVTSNK